MDIPWYIDVTEHNDGLCMSSNISHTLKLTKGKSRSHNIYHSVCLISLGEHGTYLLNLICQSY